MPIFHFSCRVAVVGLGASTSLMGCSLIVDPSAAQCGVDSDCTELAGAGAMCRSGICVPLQTEGSTSLGMSSSEDPSSTSASPAGTSRGPEADSSSAAEPLDPAWACLENPLPMATDDVELTIQLADVITGQPPDVTEARLCALLDSACMTPITELEFVNGEADVTVSAGFEGYVEVLAMEATPALVYVPPAVRDAVYRTPIVPDSLIDSSASLLGAEFDRETRSAMITEVRDCSGELAAGIVMMHSGADETTTQFYGTLPDDEATSTSSDGTGGFLNVATGFETWTAAVEETGQQVRELRMMHRAGWLSLAVFDATLEYETP